MLLLLWSWNNTAAEGRIAITAARDFLDLLVFPGGWSACWVERLTWRKLAHASTSSEQSPLSLESSIWKSGRNKGQGPYKAYRQPQFLCFSLSIWSCLALAGSGVLCPTGDLSWQSSSWIRRWNGQRLFRRHDQIQIHVRFSENYILAVIIPPKSLVISVTSYYMVLPWILWQILGPCWAIQFHQSSSRVTPLQWSLPKHIGGFTHSTWT